MFTEHGSGPKGDASALVRQKRRLKRLKEQGVTRSTVLVHERCRPALDVLRPHLIDDSKASALKKLLLDFQEKAEPTNVAQVRQLSPFRYPGGKTWLVPEIRKWLLSSKDTPSVFVEPFAGGAMAGLTVASDKLAKKVVLSELDADVAAVWSTLFTGTDDDVVWLCDSITTFKVSLTKVKEILASEPRSDKGRAFRTIIKNRMNRGGIMAAGAGLVKAGENGKGLHSRWYPETLATRIKLIRAMKGRVLFEVADAFEVVRRYTADSNAFFFVDPPYTAGGKQAGKRLYTHSEVDHPALFALMASVRGSVMMTYDDSSEVRLLAKEYGFRIAEVPMKNTHHEVIRELLILKP